MKILLECHHTIGDVIMTFPALHNLKQLYPSAKITYLGGLEAEIPLIMNTGEVEHCYIYNVKEQGTLALAKLMLRLRKEHYDLGLALGQSPKGLDIVFLKLAGCRRILSMKNPAAIYQGYEQIDLSCQKHRVWQHIELIKALGGNGQIKNPFLKIDNTMLVRIQNRYRLKENEKGKRIGLCLGTGDFFYRRGKKKICYNTKKWKLNHFLELSSCLQRDGYQVLFLGGVKEKKELENAGKRLDEIGINLLGKLSLLETVAVMKSCCLIVGADTGPMHCAAAADVPTVTLFGPTDAEQIGPFGEKAIFVYADTDCTKCYSENKEKGQGCQSASCMEAITVKQVYQTIKELLI